MEEIKDSNLENVKMYLRANGLDESLAESPIFRKKFSIQKVSVHTGPATYRVWFNKEKNILEPSLKDDRGHRVMGPNVKIKQEGKMIVIEEQKTDSSRVNYAMDDPIGSEDGYVENSIEDVKYYLDETASMQLAKETRRVVKLNRDVSESDLYQQGVRVSCEINEDALKTVNPADYHLIMVLRENAKLRGQYKRQTKTEPESK